jgi:formate dehydrogenase major subunit
VTAVQISKVSQSSEWQQQYHEFSENQLDLLEQGINHD